MTCFTSESQVLPAYHVEKSQHKVLVGRNCYHTSDCSANDWCGVHDLCLLASLYPCRSRWGAPSFSLVTFPHTNEYCAPSKFDPDNRYVDNH